MSAQEPAPRDNDLWVICESDAIRPGDVMAFKLERVAETGQHEPFSILIARTVKNRYYGYVNACPHEGTALNFFKIGEFFTQDRAMLKCGRHGATFQIDTGACVTGPCQGKYLEPIKLTVANGEICLSGVQLVEDDYDPDPFGDLDDTMEIMISPD